MLTTTLEIVVPVFLVVACGWLFASRGLVAGAGTAAITNFVFYLAIPALLFRTLATGGVQEQFDWAILGAYYGGALLNFVAAWLLSRGVFGTPADAAGLAGMAGTFSNLGLIGLPLVQRAYGDAGLVPFMLIIMVQSAIIFTVTTLAVEIPRGRGRGWLRSVAAPLRSVAVNPIVVAALGGMAFGFTGLPLPAIVDETLVLLGRAAGPVALFVLGCSLVGCRIAGDLRETLAITAVKLIAMPATVYVLAAHVFGQRPGWVTVAVLAAAMPCGANVYVFARRYDAYVNRATAAVVLTTLCSVATVTALIALLPPP
ncbi:MAG: AEC family transporter [Caenispirillum bisanense]|nr:AEC family transporter [Caenispirillum bisanense]MCA1973447.1 AEC family transporter [Caenispirillum sp.]